MNKKYLFFIIILIIIIGIAGFILYNNYQNNKTHENTNNTTKLAIESNETNNEVQDAQKQNIIEKNNSVSNENRTEEEISSYSSPLKSKASGRLNNIKITCSALNGTIVHKGDTFSFCNTLGPSTAEKGYEKADVIINGETEQALGGGNCQVSSTLYNAILKVSDFKVTERHPHGKKVNYVPEGKDAAVSYGSKDLKFVNNTSNTIKIYASTDNKKVSIKIVSVK